ncbi:MAG: Chitin synthase, class 5 [Phylliscum demangeonii]|nr:MAG: Chitin synthase, class 5 [Phylliscum demangeonii]
MLFSLEVGKVHAGVAVLLTQDKRLARWTPFSPRGPHHIEFPSILLPADIAPGSIVDITVGRNVGAEAASGARFHALQDEIYRTYGQRSPRAPVLRCRNATQTSVVLEWDPMQLATATLRSLSLYRNGSKAGSIPKPGETQSTKISGLAVDTSYTFHLVLRTSAGTYPSAKLAVRTHKMTDLCGITVTAGVLPAPVRASVEKAVARMAAKMADSVRIDTTHFVCTDGRGQPWERAVEMNIPVVRPEWLDACEREGRIVGVRGYYLNADPRLRQMGQPVPSPRLQAQSQPQSQPPPPPPSPRRPPADAVHERSDPRPLPDRTMSRRSAAGSVPDALGISARPPSSAPIDGRTKDDDDDDGGGGGDDDDGDDRDRGHDPDEHGNKDDDDDDDDGPYNNDRSAPPTPPAKDPSSNLPEPKSVRAEPKARVANAAHLGTPSTTPSTPVDGHSAPTKPATTPVATTAVEADLARRPANGRSGGDGESFSEVVL